MLIIFESSLCTLQPELLGYFGLEIRGGRKKINCKEEGEEERKGRRKRTLSPLCYFDSNQLLLSFRTALSPHPKPVVFNFLCQLCYPVRFLVVQSCWFPLLAGPLSAAPSQCRPSTAVRESLTPSTLSAHADLCLARNRPNGCSAVPGNQAWKQRCITPPIRWEFITQ